MVVSTPTDKKQHGGVSLAYEGKRDIPAIFAQKLGSFIRQEDALRPNRLYHGDNLSVMSLLCHDDYICKKVTLAYIDPPYATEGAFYSRQMEHAYSDDLAGAEYLESLRHRIVFHTSPFG